MEKSPEEKILDEVLGELDLEIPEPPVEEVEPTIYDQVAGWIQIAFDNELDDLRYMGEDEIVQDAKDGNYADIRETFWVSPNSWEIKEANGKIWLVTVTEG